MRLRGGIGVEDRRARHVALDEANALAVFEIDRGKQDHGRHLRKLAISLRPSVWLFSGVKLRAGDVAAGDDRRHRAAVVGGRDEVAGVVRVQLIGVDEIGVQSARPVLTPSRSGWLRRTSRVFHPICGIFSSGSRGLIARDVARDPVQAGDHLMLEAARRHQLRADADAQERPASLAHRLVHRLDHAGNAVESAAAVGECAHSRQHDMVGGEHILGARGDAHLATQAGLARGALEGFPRRVQIAGAIIDDGDAHRMSP